MRAFELFLKRTPYYVPADLDATTDTPQWARRATGFSLVAHPCVQDTSQDEILLDIARTIPAVKPPSTNLPRLGTLLPDAPVLPDELEAQTKPWQDAMSTLLAAVDATPISALTWKAGCPEIASLDDDIWLLCLLHEEALRRKRSVDVRFEAVTVSADRLSGMIRITDIMISKAPQ